MRLGSSYFIRPANLDGFKELVSADPGECEQLKGRVRSGAGSYHFLYLALEVGGHTFFLDIPA